jgi:hypothetical protein
MIKEPYFVSFSVTPIPHSPRHSLLLRDIHKAIPAFHSDHAYMPAAIILCDRLDKEIDNNSAREKRNQEITGVQHLFGRTVKIRECGRHFVARKERRFLSPLRSRL